MSNSERGNSDVIEARAAPLSHLADTEKTRWSWRLDWRSNALLAALVLALVFAFTWEPEITPTAVPQAAIAPAASPAQANNDEELPPFAQLTRQRTRELVQRQLGRFVDQQILLEDTMQVGKWGAADLQQAKNLALEADADFVAERFQGAIDKYEQATLALTTLIQTGNELFKSHLENGLAGIDERDQARAVRELTSALTIKPESPAAKQALVRAERLPEIIALLRTAKNHELGGRFNDAVAVYDAIAQIDPAVDGLAELRSAAVAGAQGNNLNAYLSQGFAALDRNAFEEARSAFNKALQLDPGNDVAAGGLQQVRKEHDLAIIARHRFEAEQAIDAEGWPQAIDAYEQILDMDANIQFALSGKRIASAHERVDRLLTRIRSEPQKLSNEKLYLDAQVIVREAHELSKKGPILNAKLAEVEQLLSLYRDPVDVLLLSDNATEIVVSNVGKLGSFESKTLSLRPGQYTIRGSRDGCRDIFLSIDVLPGIAPIDLSCRDDLDP